MDSPRTIRRCPLCSPSVSRSRTSKSGALYVIHARNGALVSRCVRANASATHRDKFGRHFVFVEWDWDEGEPHGTALPLRLLEDRPPEDGGALLSWLAERDRELRDEIASNYASTRVQR